MQQLLYDDIEINEMDLTDISIPERSAEESGGEVVNDCAVDNLDTAVHNEEENNENNSNPLTKYKQPRRESLIVNNNIFEIAPGEGLSTKKIMHDNNCEELAFPQLFSNGKFRYTK